MSVSEEIEKCGCDESVDLRARVRALEEALSEALRKAETSAAGAEAALQRLSDNLGDRDKLADSVAVPPETLRKSPNPMQAILHGARALRARLDESERENRTLRNEVILLRARIDQIRTLSEVPR